MTIAETIVDAITDHNAGRYRQSLTYASIAVDATATAEYGQKGRSSYKRFIRQNFGLITRMAFGGASIQNLKIEFEFPDTKPDERGLLDASDILYHVVRCELLHNAKLPEIIEFTEQQVISVCGNRLHLPASLSYGMAFACVLSPANAGVTDQPDLGVNLLDLGLAFPLGMLWGQRDHFLWLLENRDKILLIERGPASPTNCVADVGRNEAES